MRVAWFTPTSDPDAPAAVSADHLSEVAAELARRYKIERFDAASAHEFVWKHFRAPYDLCVYEIADSAAHQFIWPYLLRYPGVVVLRSPTLVYARAAAMRRSHRLAELGAERGFAGLDLVRIPLGAARLVVVFDAAVADALRDRFPGLGVRVVPVGVPGIQGSGLREPDSGADGGQLRVAVLDAAEPSERARVLAERAVARARNGGADVALLDPCPMEAALQDADAVLALRWPPDAEPPHTALRAMAAARPVVVYETEITAAWPALDPQTWQSRSHDLSELPITVSIDPRDDEHSLMLTMKRLAADAALRKSLGSAAHAWWRAHATVERAVAEWQATLDEAAALHAPRRPAGWPPHLDADGSEHVRGLLEEFGLDVDPFYLEWQARGTKRPI